MEALVPELRKVVSDLELAEGAKELLTTALLGIGKAVAPNHVLELLWLLDNLRSKGFEGLIPIQKTAWLKNLLTLIRQGGQAWVRTVCYLLYEGHLPPENGIGAFPEGFVRDLLKSVNGERSDRVREILWAVLLRKEMGLASFAKTTEVASGVCDKDPITRNNVLRFLVDHFTAEQVVDGLFQYSMTSGKRVPGVAFKRYVGLLKGLVDLPQKKSVLERILGSVELDDREIDQIYADYISVLNRFDLIRLLSFPGGRRSGMTALKPRRRQMAFTFEKGRRALRCHQGFRKRIWAIMDQPSCQGSGRFDIP